MNKLHHKRFFLIILMASFFGCNQKTYKNAGLLNSLVTDVDKIEVLYYRQNDTLKTVVTQKENINIINDLIDGKVDETIEKCKPSGHILFFKNNKSVFEAHFTIDYARKEGCQQLSYFLDGQTYNTQLTYRGGMLLSEIFNDLQKR